MSTGINRGWEQLQEGWGESLPNVSNGGREKWGHILSGRQLSYDGFDFLNVMYVSCSFSTDALYKSTFPSIPNLLSFKS